MKKMNVSAVFIFFLHINILFFVNDLFASSRVEPTDIARQREAQRMRRQQREAQRMLRQQEDAVRVQAEQERYYLDQARQLLPKGVSVDSKLLLVYKNLKKEPMQRDELALALKDVESALEGGYGTFLYEYARSLDAVKMLIEHGASLQDIQRAPALAICPKASQNVNVFFLILAEHVKQQHDLDRLNSFYKYSVLYRFCQKFHRLMQEPADAKIVNQRKQIECCISALIVSGCSLDRNYLPTSHTVEVQETNKTFIDEYINGIDEMKNASQAAMDISQMSVEESVKVAKRLEYIEALYNKVKEIINYAVKCPA